jgi:hypothetical protein
MPPGFHRFGSLYYAIGLDRHYRSKIKTLRDRQRECEDETEREEIAALITETYEEWRGKMKGINRLIF